MNDSDHELIQLYLDGNLPDHKWKEFSQRLERSTDMRREFRKLSVLDENLRDQNLGFPNLAEREQNTTTPTYLPWLVAAACLVLTFISWSTPTQSYPASTSPATNRVQLASVLEPAPPIAELIDFYDLQFQGTTKSPKDIQFDLGKYEIVRGQLHLRFDDSVELLFSGPGSFEIINPKLVSVTQGNVRTIILNDKGKEFTILSPTSRYIDWGTEFSLNISPSGDDLVNVHEGAIEVQCLGTKNMSKMLTRFSKVTDSPEFTPVLIDKNLENIMPGEMGGNRNQKLLDELAKDPYVIGLYDFKFTLAGTDELEQRIPQTWKSSKGNILQHRWVANLHLLNTDASHGIFHGANRTNGRWPQTIGLNLFQKNAHMSLDLKGEYENFSFSFWLKPTGKLDNPLNSLIRPYLWKKSGNLSIEVTRSGKLKQFLWGESHIQEFQHSKRKLTRDWNHIAYTFGKVDEKATSSLYLNGKLYNEVFPNHTDSIVLRSVIIGCLNNKYGEYLNQFNAIVDELVFWKKTLTKKEIKNFYRSGLPTYEFNELTLAVTSIDR
jgi:hypothetical protein